MKKDHDKETSQSRCANTHLASGYITALCGDKVDDSLNDNKDGKLDENLDDSKDEYDDGPDRQGGRELANGQNNSVIVPKMKKSKKKGMKKGKEGSTPKNIFGSDWELDEFMEKTQMPSQTRMMVRTWLTQMRLTKRGERRRRTHVSRAKRKRQEGRRGRRMMPVLRLLKKAKVKRKGSQLIWIQKNNKKKKEKK